MNLTFLRRLFRRAKPTWLTRKQALEAYGTWRELFTSSCEIPDDCKVTVQGVWLAWSGWLISLDEHLTLNDVKAAAGMAALHCHSALPLDTPAPLAFIEAYTGRAIERTPVPPSFLRAWDE